MALIPIPGINSNRFNWPAVARESAQLIAKHGQSCILRRASGDRWVQAFIRRITAREMVMGGLVDPLMRYAIVAAPISPPPDHQQDRLITFIQPIGDVPQEDENLRIVAAPEMIKPGGVVAFWKLAVRK